VAEESFQIGGGGFRGASPATLGQGLNRTLGLQGPELPSFDASQVQPVFLVGDTSQSLSRALAVRRGWSARRQAINVANIFVLGLRGYASAGCVIERIRITPVAPAVFALPFQVQVGSLPTLNLPGLAIGGTDMNEFIGGITEGPRFTQRVPTGPGQLSVIPASFDPLELPIFIPPGDAFLLETGDVGVDVDWEMVWREVPE